MRAAINDIARHAGVCKYNVFIISSLIHLLRAVLPVLIYSSLTVENVRAADVRYEIRHLQEAYGEEWFFTGMSPNGVITATSPTGIATVVGADFQSFPYPFQNSTFLSTFGDSETMYAERVGTPGSPMLEGISSIDRLGNVVDTGYTPRGTGMTLGRQNSLGTVVGRETGIPGSAGFVYSPTTGGQSFDTLGGVNVTRFSAINNNDWIIGNGIASTVNGDVSGMFLWVPGEDGLLLEPGFGVPRVINDDGQIIGRQGSSAFIWDEGNLQLISDLLIPDPNNPSEFNNATVFGSAHGLNAGGEVVGFINLRDVPGYERPFSSQGGWIWTEEEGLLLLDDLIDPGLDLHLGSGIAIDDHGRILADAEIDGVVQHFLLTRIPEPTTTGFLLIGILLSFRRSR